LIFDFSFLSGRSNAGGKTMKRFAKLLVETFMPEPRRFWIALMLMTLGWGVVAQAQQPKAGASNASSVGNSPGMPTVKGSGTTNSIPVWTSSSTIGNSVMSQSGGNVNVGGGVNLTGSINNALTLQGNLTGSPGDESANVIGGFGGAGGIPGNSVAPGVVGATIAGGGGEQAGINTPNTVGGNWGTVGGGFDNSAALQATVAGGANNTASGQLATVGGGALNIASGELATVPGGNGNLAAGSFSFAAGSNARANNGGSFVWSDASSFGVIVGDTGANQFVARAAGGFTFYTASDLSTGATLASGSGSWSSLSDRNVKANFNAVDGQALLARLAALPISTWNYKAQPESIRHMGPTAQDFRAAFGLGEDESHISTVDAQGVALAAIQALYQITQEKDRKIKQLTREVKELQARVSRLANR
jgi:hypothetical protein